MKTKDKALTFILQVSVAFFLCSIPSYIVLFLMYGIREEMLLILLVTFISIKIYSYIFNPKYQKNYKEKTMTPILTPTNVDTPIPQHPIERPSATLESEDSVTTPEELRGTITLKSPHKTHADFVFPKAKRDVLIRMGSMVESEAGTALAFNSIQGIRNCSNKVKMKELFRDNDIPSPDFRLDSPFTEYPFICKKRNHSRGKGMVKVTSADLLPTRRVSTFYYESFVDCNEEFRVHVLDKEIFHTDKKILRDGKEDTWFKNLKNYVYLPYNKRGFSENMREQIIKSVDCLGLTFGAVDIGRNTRTGEFWIYEVNSAPGMRPSLKRRYTNAFVAYIEKELG